MVVKVPSNQKHSVIMTISSRLCFLRLAACRLVNTVEKPSWPKLFCKTMSRACYKIGNCSHVGLVIALYEKGSFQLDHAACLRPVLKHKW